MSSPEPFCIEVPSVSPPGVADEALPLIETGAVNVAASMPCPLKVRFKMEFAEFGAAQAAAGTPVHCPQALEGQAAPLADHLHAARGEDELPDVLVNPPLSVVFSQALRPRLFAAGGAYLGITRPADLAALPAAFQAAAHDHNLGFLAFGSWQVLWDRTLSDERALPKTWTDLADPAQAGRLAVHGCHGTIGANALLLVLRDRLGPEGVTRFAGNVVRLAHFAQLIKQLGAGPERAPLNVMPDAASLQMPTRKDAAIIEFRDGPLLTPMTLFVKRSRLEACRAVLDFFWGEAFGAVLTRGGYRTPQAMDWRQPYTWPSWETLAGHDYEALAAEVEAAFQAGLRRGAEAAA